MLESSGVTNELHAEGIIARHWQFRDRQDGLVAEFDLDLLRDDTRFPYRLQCEQHKFVHMVEAWVRKHPLAEIRSGIRVTGCRQVSDRVEIEIDDEYTGLDAPWLIGADGGRSVIRKSEGIGFEGFTYPERFLVITTSFDLEPLGYAYSNYIADPDEWAATFKVPGEGPPGLWRVVFPTDPAAPESALLDVEFAQGKLKGFLGEDNDYEIVHVNLYQVHQRVATSYRQQRIMLAGDACHVNNPLGGMGMNFGIHDAASLAERLSAVWHGRADAALLDQYDRQRRHVAEAYLQSMTIRNKETLEETDPVRRAARQDELRQTAADPVAARRFLLNTAMLEGLAAAAAID
jgi:3-(3-hydroxy-phenyl)propionate hydroxylase